MSSGSALAGRSYTGAIDGAEPVSARYPLDLARPQFEPHEVKVLWLEADVEAFDVGPFAAVLDQTEQYRADRFIHARDRNRFVIAHGLMRHVLAAHIGDRPARLRFGVGAHGKPMLLDHRLAFNMSHSGGVVTVAIAAANRAVGIDVEQIRPLPDMAGLIGHVASVEEGAAWGALPDVRREAAFFELWTRKEAVTKATGTGLSRAPNSFTVGAGDVEVRLSDDTAMQEGVLSVRSLDLAPGYAGALAVSGAPARLRAIRLRVAKARSEVELGSQVVVDGLGPPDQLDPAVPT